MKPISLALLLTTTLLGNPITATCQQGICVGNPCNSDSDCDQSAGCNCYQPDGGTYGTYGTCH